MFAVDVKALKPGVYQRAARVTADDLELEADALSAAGFAIGPGGVDVEAGRPLGPIEVALVLTLSSGQLMVDVEISTDAWLVCDRTLEPYLERIEGRHQVYCAEADPDDEEADDFVHLDPGQETLDLTSTVRDTVLLAVPLRRVSPEGEAMELATRFGEGGGTDPRWDALKALRPADDADAEPQDRESPNGASSAA